MSELEGRKRSHLELCATQDVEHHGRTLLDDVHLLHDALPELSIDEIDLATELLGRRVEAPILISGMSGGTPEAGRLNRALAAAAEKFGLGMGVGSQRAMLLDPATVETYRVRDVAPNILLLANLGVVQARDAGPGAAAELVDAVHADALCIHLNPAQELAQDEGDRDFRGCAATLEALVAALPVPVIVKETGCGLSRRTLARLRGAGVRWVDVAGAGGTSWPGVESLRGSARQRALGGALREWGIPTAASLCFAREAGFDVIASGGLRDAGDVMRALALGAELGGMALPWLRAHERGGLAGVLTFAEALTESLRAMMLLVGARKLDELARLPRVLGPRLRAWLAEGARDER